MCMFWCYLSSRVLMTFKSIFLAQIFPLSFRPHIFCCLLDNHLLEIFNRMASGHFQCILSHVEAIPALIKLISPVTSLNGPHATSSQKPGRCFHVSPPHQVANDSSRIYLLRNSSPSCCHCLVWGVQYRHFLTGF